MDFSDSDISLDLTDLRSPPSRKCSACKTESYKFMRVPSNEVQTAGSLHGGSLLKARTSLLPPNRTRKTVSASPPAAPTLPDATRRPGGDTTAAVSVPLASPDHPTPGPFTSNSRQYHMMLNKLSCSSEFQLFFPLTLKKEGEYSHFLLIF